VLFSAGSIVFGSEPITPVIAASSPLFRHEAASAANAIYIIFFINKPLL
jgi:hypothetical protein